MTHSPDFDIFIGDLLATGATGWTTDDQCRHACDALTTSAGLDALRKGLSMQHDDRFMSLLTTQRMAIIRNRMNRIAGGRG